MVEIMTREQKKNSFFYSTQKNSAFHAYLATVGPLKNGSMRSLSLFARTDSSGCRATLARSLSLFLNYNYSHNAHRNLVFRQI